MSSILLFWIGLAIGFVILELLTATFYGLSLALASCIVALHIYFSGDTVFQILHAVIFVFSSAVFAFLLPKYLVSHTPDMPQGMDQYIGLTRSVKKIGTDLKISLDGVEYLIESDNQVSAGDKVEIMGHHGVSMKVKKLIKPMAKK